VSSNTNYAAVVSLNNKRYLSFLVQANEGQTRKCLSAALSVVLSTGKRGSNAKGLISRKNAYYVHVQPFFVHHIWLVLL